MRTAEQHAPVAIGDAGDARAAAEWRSVATVPAGPASALRRRLGSSPIPANAVGAVVVYFYFTFVDPLASNFTRDKLRPFFVFISVTTTLLLANWYFGRRFFGPVITWRRRLRSGADAGRVPEELRRRALNAPLVNATLSAAGWTLAGCGPSPASCSSAGRSPRHSRFS